MKSKKLILNLVPLVFQFAIIPFFFFEKWYDLWTTGWISYISMIATLIVIPLYLIIINYVIFRNYISNFLKHYLSVIFITMMSSFMRFFYTDFFFSGNGNESKQWNTALLQATIIAPVIIITIVALVVYMYNKSKNA